jgi:hypothetical protein
MNEPVLPPDNTFDLKVEEDGTMTIVTGVFAEEIHKQADEMLEFLEEQLGTTRVTTQLKIVDHHVHLHGGHARNPQRRLKQ